MCGIFDWQSDVGKDCYKKIWRKEGCAGTPKYTEAIKKKLYSELVKDVKSQRKEGCGKFGILGGKSCPKSHFLVFLRD